MRATGLRRQSGGAGKEDALSATALRLHRGGSGGRGASLCVPQGECLDLVLGLDVEDDIQALLGQQTVSLDAVDLVRLELGEHVAQLVDASLVEGLQLLEDVGRLVVPLALRIVKLAAGVGNCDRLGLAALVRQALVLLQRVVNVLG